MLYANDWKGIQPEQKLPAGIYGKLARTTFAHLSQKGTGDVYATKSAMGHSKVATTEIYLASAVVEADEATNALARLFGV